MDVAPTQRGLFQITELVEHEQWMITGAAEAAIVGRALCTPCVGSELSISSTIIFGALCSWTRSIQVPDKLSSLASHCVRSEPSGSSGGNAVGTHAIHDGAHRRISRQTARVVHVLVAG
jgi:hypothetical protein